MAKTGRRKYHNILCLHHNDVVSELAMLLAKQDAPNPHDVSMEEMHGKYDVLARKICRKITEADVAEIADSMYHDQMMENFHDCIEQWLEENILKDELVKAVILSQLPAKKEITT